MPGPVLRLPSPTSPLSECSRAPVSGPQVSALSGVSAALQADNDVSIDCEYHHKEADLGVYLNQSR